MNKQTERTLGVLFLIAMFSSLIGGGIIEAIIGAPDFLTGVVDNQNTLQLGIILEFINALAVLGIPILFFPLLNGFDQRIAVGYLTFRAIESIVCIIPAMKVLALIPLGESAVKATAEQMTNLQMLGSSLIAERTNMAELLVPLFFSLSAFLLYYYLYQTRLIPRFISVWGFLGASSILLMNILGIGMPWGMVMALPIILNEIFLGFWLITKGLKKTIISHK